MLRNVLNDTKLKEIQLRLTKEEPPPKDYNCLTSMENPGHRQERECLPTGRETNREIIQVDISQLKSMWFGESQKLVRRLFSDYKDSIRYAEHQSVLLFNEADAFISKRSEALNSNTSQTENAIQNIILEELEKFEGIFIATTNLLKQKVQTGYCFLNVAFFKIELKPTITVK